MIVLAPTHDYSSDYLGAKQFINMLFDVILSTDYGSILKKQITRKCLFDENYNLLTYLLTYPQFHTLNFTHNF